ncbi:MAG: hypothetical protein ABL867_01065 [Rickettsiales bacterium]
MKNTIKDENLLTTSSLTISRMGICLGVSTILLLTGCGMSSVTDMFGDGRSSQKIDGGRRAPTHNSRAIKSPDMPPATSNKLPPMVTSVSPQKVETPLDDPYDKYDAYGNEVPEAEVVQAENDSGSKKGFFSGWFSFDDETPKEVVESKEPVERIVEPIVARKSFLGNPYRPKGIANPLMGSSVPLSPQSKLEAKESKIMFVDAAEPEKASIIVVEKASDQNTNVNVGNNTELLDSASVPPADVPPAEPEETLLGSIGSKLDVFRLSASEPEKARPTAYPDLSSVPPRPEAFDAVKRDQQQNFNELKQEHGISKQEKELLEREAPTPSVPDTSNQSPSSLESEPLKEDLSPVAGVVTVPPLQPALEHPPAPFLASEKSNIEENSVPVIVETMEEDKPNFFERIFSSFSETKPVEETFSGVVENQETETVASISSLSEVNIEASSDNKEEAHEKAKVIDDIAASAVAIAESPIPSADPAYDPASQSLDVPDSLPSPAIIKTIRPSRYDTRRTQTSGY